MDSTVKTVTRLSRRAALLLFMQTLVACSAAPRMTATPQPAATVTPEATPTAIAFWPVLDAPAYRLQVTGLVASPLDLTLETLQSLPRTDAERVLMCMEMFFHDKSVWSGAALDRVLALASPSADATKVTLIGADQYEQTIPLAEAAGYTIAHARAGEPLASKDGFPVRAVSATDEGWKWVRWLVEIKVS